MEKPTSVDCFLDRLTVLESELQADRGDFEEIYSLVASLPELDSVELIDEYRVKVCPRLVTFLTSLVRESKRRKAIDSRFEDHDVDLRLMRFFALSGYRPGLQTVADLIQQEYKKDEYFWTGVLENIKTRELGDTIVDRLDGKLPDGFLGVLYLNMLGEICSRDRPYRPHPFASPQGIARIKGYIADPDKNKLDYAVCATLALVFLPEEIWRETLPLAFRHDNVQVRITSAYVGAKLGQEQYRNALVDFAKDCRYFGEAGDYLKKLGLLDLVPLEIQTDEFAALAEMSLWLVYPTEFGEYPTEISVVDRRTLFWPPTQNEQTLTIVRYRYEGWNKDGSDEIGIGLVGPTTFSLFDDEMNRRSPEEIYAIHCDWEAGLDEDLDAGLRELKKRNPGFGD